MVSFKSREALRMNQQRFLTKSQSDAIQHKVLLRNPEAYGYTPGHVFVDAGNAVYHEVLSAIARVCPFQTEQYKRLGEDKQADLLEAVLAPLEGAKPLDFFEHVGVSHYRSGSSPVWYSSADLWRPTS